MSANAIVFKVVSAENANVIDKERLLRRLFVVITAFTFGFAMVMPLQASSAFAATSTTPANWSVTFKTLATHILVGADATAAVMPDGRIRIYWAAGEGLASAVSSDGVHFTQEPGIRLQMSIGGPHIRVLALPDGRWRLFFTDQKNHGIGSAVSDNGLDFTVEPGLRVSVADAGVSTPDLSTGDVIKLPDGRWRMYFSSFSFVPRPPEKVHEVIKSAVSSDLLTWTVESGIRVGGTTGITGSGEHPSAIQRSDGTIALFYGRPVPFHAYVSLSHDGLTFTQELPVVDEVLDVAAVPRPDGSALVYYGTYVAATNISYLNVGSLTFGTTPPVQTCAIPDVRGKSLAAAKTLIVSRHCAVGTIKYAYSSKLSKGWVISQRPGSSTKILAKGTKIALVVSRGKK